MQNNEQSVKEIRAAIAQWAAALEKKDLETMYRDYAQKYTLFDVGKTANDVEETKKLWEKCLPYFDAPKIEYKDMVIYATDDMAAVHFRSQVLGTVAPMPESLQNIWLRGTVCYLKMDGVWKCIHEHISLPINCETMTVAQAA